MRDLLTNRLDKTVYIKADARAKYEAVEDVVDNLRAAGVDQIGLADRAEAAGRRRSKPGSHGRRSNGASTRNEEND